MATSPMDFSLLLLPTATIISPLLFLSLTFVSFLFFAPGGFAWSISRSSRREIPGPAGSLLSFSSPVAHRKLSELSHSLGASRLMAFSVGLTRFVVASRPGTAKEILNSSAFADRPVKESAYELLFHRAMGFAPFGEYWRSLRRISATFLFSPRRIQAFGAHRRAIGERMVREVKEAMAADGEVGVKMVLHFASLNNVMVGVFGRGFDFAKGEGVELEAMVREGYELLGSFNWGDHFPLLGWLDLQRVRRRCRCLAGRVDVFVRRIIDEHRRKKETEEGVGIDTVDDDFVDVLLSLGKEDKLSDSDMVAVLWEMIFRGTDTVAILLEWIMARMVLHPEIQSKAQSEIDSVTGTSRPVRDSDIPNLPYLQSIVKECLRLHPPGPLLSWARLAVHDVHVGEYFVPRGTTAMVNMWSITHDKSIWSEPDAFKPERFTEEDVSILGSDLRLAPFGSGRRVCPGKAMGLATVHLWLAQLLQSFTWVPSDRVGVDLSECLKMSLEMKSPLSCMAFPRY